MISLHHISKIYAAGTSNEICALHDINLEIKAGEYVTIIGSNGSGKSTLLNVLAGNTIMDKGDLLFENEKVNQLRDFERSKWIARVFQNPLAGTAHDLSILDNFRLAALRSKRKNPVMGTDKKFADHVKEKISLLGLGLENKINQRMGTLSGGQRQALTLVMSVMDEAKILLMDEPAAALDPKTADLIMKLASKIIGEFSLTAILVTHQMKDAIAYGTRLIFMQEGKIIRDLNASQKQIITIHDIYGWF